MANERLYAARDTTTGKLVSDITNPKRKYWDRKGNAENAIDYYNRAYANKNHRTGNKGNHGTIELVTFVLVEETDWLTRGIPKEQLEKEKAEALVDIVEVVRCKDCCWCMVTSQPYAAAYCIKGTRSFIVEADDFCSRGERKEG